MLDTKTVNMTTVDSFVLLENDDENEYEMDLHSLLSPSKKKAVTLMNDHWLNDSMTRAQAHIRPKEHFGK